MQFVADPFPDRYPLLAVKSNSLAVLGWTDLAGIRFIVCFHQFDELHSCQMSPKLEVRHLKLLVTSRKKAA